MKLEIWLGVPGLGLGNRIGGTWYAVGMAKVHPCRKREADVLSDLLAGVEKARRDGGDEAVRKYLDRVERHNKSLPPKAAAALAAVREELADSD